MTDKPIYEILAEMGRAAMPDDLPEPYYPQWSHSNEFNAYTADQMCAYAAAAVAKERERLRGCFRDALADTGITWPGEVDILYGKCFPKGQ